HRRPLAARGIENAQDVKAAQQYPNCRYQTQAGPAYSGTRFASNGRRNFVEGAPMTETDESPNRRTGRRIAVAAVVALLIAVAEVVALLVQSRPSPPTDGDNPAPNVKLRFIVAVHGGYTSELHQDEATLKAKQDSIACVIALAEDYLLGRGDNQRQHTAVETA